jgi:hypothetical protein
MESGQLAELLGPTQSFYAQQLYACGPPMLAVVGWRLSLAERP